LSDWYLYLIRTRDGSLYTGITKDVERRFAEHRADRSRGSRYLRGRGPLALVYQARIGEHGLALRVENRLRRFVKERKEAIVRSSPSGKALLRELALEPD